MNFEQSAKILKECLEKRLPEIIKIGEDIYRNPEPGFQEHNTAALAAKKLESLGLIVNHDPDIPVVTAYMDTGKPGPVIAVMGEMDCVVCFEHPDCTENGYVHACGHHVQVADMIGCAALLKDSGLLKDMCGKIKFMAVPAEEHIQQDFRMDLVRKGKLTFTGGKTELVYRGFFDDVDMAMMVHVLESDAKLSFGSTCNGCLIKQISYKGKAAHAGGAPHEGINALYAANLGLNAINALRETFKEEDSIRVHPIITKGGDTVNVIPSEVNIGTYVRGKTLDAILEVNKKVDRALAGTAAALGCRVEIEDVPGYFPLSSDPNFTSFAFECAKILAGDKAVRIGHMGISTDMGDLSMIMPVIHPYVGGAKGGLHSGAFKIDDKDTAYGTGTHFLALTAYGLLSDNGACAFKIKKEHVPYFSSKEEFIRCMKDLSRKVLYPKKDILED
jgi:amidohydrolase